MPSSLVPDVPNRKPSNVVLAVQRGIQKVGPLPRPPDRVIHWPGRVRQAGVAGHLKRHPRVRTPDFNSLPPRVSGVSGRWGADAGIRSIWSPGTLGRLWEIQAKAYGPEAWITKRGVEHSRHSTQTGAV